VHKANRIESMEREEVPAIRSRQSIKNESSGALLLRRLSIKNTIRNKKPAELGCIRRRCRFDQWLRTPNFNPA
jgi:hypothetical protein